MLEMLNVDLFVTLSFSQDTRFQRARPLLVQWFARLDNHYLGRSWARRSSDERTFAIAVPENISTNLHYHCLMRLPAWGRTQPIPACAVELDRYWHRLVPGGTCDVQPIDYYPGRPATSPSNSCAPGMTSIICSPASSTRPGKGPTQAARVHPLLDRAGVLDPSRCEGICSSRGHRNFRSVK